MQIINQWPEDIQLALPESTKQVFLEHLIKPFGDKDIARDFWEEYPSVIVIIDKMVDVDYLDYLSTLTKRHVEQALNNPEYTEQITNNTYVSLTILSDDGAGIYLVVGEHSET